MTVVAFFLYNVTAAKISVPVTTRQAEITKLISLEPVKSEINPVNVGAITAELMPKKLNRLNALPNVFDDACSETKEIRIGSTAILPSKPYRVRLTISIVVFGDSTVNTSIAAAIISRPRMTLTLLLRNLSDR